MCLCLQNGLTLTCASFPQVVLIVHVPIDKNEESYSTGAVPPPPPSWVCTRQMGEFHSLHRNLTPYVSWVKNLELPTSPKSIFGGGKQTR